MFGADVVTCTKCGWVSFAVSREYAEKAVKGFIDYYNALSHKDKEFWRGVNADGSLRPARMPSVADYVCLHCSGSSFRPAKDGDCPGGCTLNPVIVE